MFPLLPPTTNRFETESRILKFWQTNRVFARSISQRPAKEVFSFYDGPPFVTGSPHYGTLLSSIAKDLIPRYFAMKGKRVRRVWGWDCHGLPIEHQVEKKLGLKSRRDIEKIGLKRFIAECRRYVDVSSAEWEWYIDHIGRWVDFTHAYRTMDREYMETVMWVFKSIYQKGLIYQGQRVSLYCPRCVTPVSHFEIAMDNSYIEVTEPSNVYQYQLKTRPDTFLLAWSTTPWNKLATPALAVHPRLTYLTVKQGKNQYILAESARSILTGKYTIIGRIKGREMEGWQFVPHFDFYPVRPADYAYRVTTADFVTAEEGTGIVTIAAYGEEDFLLMQAKNIPVIEHLDAEGFIKPIVKGYAGLYYLKANPKVNADLASRGLVYREDPHTHSVPVCWRCRTRLIYAPQKAWFINIKKLKKALLATNQPVNWIPSHIKNGRFALGIKEAPDWCISRNRYWATPMPVWQCTRCRHQTVVGSIAEIEKLSGRKVVDLHRPAIDDHVFSCPHCPGTMKRVPEVLDCWLESGSMPYGERHYPFANRAAFRASFPADFISEYVAQTRAWFYVMHVISNALFKTHCFKNVIVTGVIMGSDGRKMSKSYHNYPDPRKTLIEYGGDALRLYLMGSSLLLGENINVSAEELKDRAKTVLLPIYNILRYFASYASLHRFRPHPVSCRHLLDRWLTVRTARLVQEMDQSLGRYQVPAAVRLIQPFVNDLSTRYIRLCRTRFVNGDSSALMTLYTVLKTMARTLAPVVPFISEEIFSYLRLPDEPISVHLTDYPAAARLKPADQKLLSVMEQVGAVLSSGLSSRKKLGIPLRQPLASATIHSVAEPAADWIDLVCRELNVKRLIWHTEKRAEPKVTYDTRLTPALQAEGEARFLIRRIAAERKKMGLSFKDRIVVYAPSWPDGWATEIKKKAWVDRLLTAPQFRIVKQ